MYYLFVSYQINPVTYMYDMCPSFTPKIMKFYSSYLKFLNSALAHLGN